MKKIIVILVLLLCTLTLNAQTKTGFGYTGIFPMAKAGASFSLYFDNYSAFYVAAASSDLVLVRPKDFIENEEIIASGIIAGLVQPINSVFAVKLGASFFYYEKHTRPNKQAVYEVDNKTAAGLDIGLRITAGKLIYFDLTYATAPGGVAAGVGFIF